jgi:methylmalonyl-CoA/ethylmalonyl-CoA epimerase
MFEKVDHVGIAVPALDKIIEFYRDVMGVPLEGIEEVADQKVRVAMFPVGATHLEFLEPTSPESPIAKFIEKKGAGIHHVALAVDDVEGMLARLKEKGARLIDEKPRTGAGGKKIAFVHPASTGGVLLELTQEGEGGHS